MKYQLSNLEILVVELGSLTLKLAQGGMKWK